MIVSLPLLLTVNRRARKLEVALLGLFVNRVLTKNGIVLL